MQSISIDAKPMAWQGHMKSVMGLERCTDKELFQKAAAWAAEQGIAFDDDAFGRYCTTRRTLAPDIPAHVKRFIAFKLLLEVEEPLLSSEPAQASKVVVDFVQGKSEKDRRSSSVMTRSLAASQRNAPRYVNRSGGRRN